MLNNIAVILRGHVRTWDYVHPAVFHFYDQLALNVDYYFVTWSNLNVAPITIENSFNNFNKKLVKLLFVYPDKINYHSYRGVSYLSYNVIPYMLKRHREVGYDYVFNSRPDVIYKIKNNVSKNFDLDTCYTTGYVCQKDELGQYHIGVDDHFFASSFDINLTMNMRHIDRDYLGSHAQILKFAMDYNIKIARLEWMMAHIVRPIASVKCPDPFLFFDRDYKSDDVDWFNMAKEEKIKLLQKCCISLEDYITNSLHASL